jgi:hypothetical protein
MNRLYHLVLLCWSIGALSFSFGDGGLGKSSRLFPANAVDGTPRPARLVASEQTIPDYTVAPRVLMFHALSYDSVYGRTLRTLIQDNFPEADIVDFGAGDGAALQQALTDRQVVVVVYPSARVAPRQVQHYGAVLGRFAESGGTVLLTGSHDDSVWRQLGLLAVRSAYYCPEPAVHVIGHTDALLEGAPVDFSLMNYAYPISVDDPSFTSLASVQNHSVFVYRDGYHVDAVSARLFSTPLSVLGFLPVGLGKVYYLGFEYYYNEMPSTRIFANAIRQAAHWREVLPNNPAEQQDGSLTRKIGEEYLYAGSGHTRLELKLYPNPYVSKATMELELDAAAQMAVEMVNESGRSVATLLPSRRLQAGTYRFELPDVEPGIYYVKCNLDGMVDTRKVVKSKAL